ncbi:MAG: SDR family oxidoreductase, partial [Rubrivivax sp.]
NCVEPGFIDTATHDGFTGQAAREPYLAATPMKRAGTVEDCVGAFLFLASAKTGGYITGQVLAINGGAAMF